MTLPATFTMRRNCTVYHWGESRLTLAQEWSIPKKQISVYVTEGVATVEAENGVPEQMTPVPAEAFPAALLPAGWYMEAIVSILARLAEWRKVCLWVGPPFPPESIDGDGPPGLPEGEQEYYSLQWSAQRWRQGWIDVFPSQMRSRGPEDEILRQWSSAARERLAWFPEHRALVQAVRLEAGARESEHLWEAVTRALIQEPLAENLWSRLRLSPVSATLVNRMIRRFFEWDYHSHVDRLDDLRDRSAKIEQEFVPPARAWLRAKVAQNYADPCAAAAARLLLTIGEPADVDVLQGITSLDLRGWFVTESIARCLAGMTWLQKLDLSGSDVVGGPKLLKPLVALSGLKNLALAGLELKNGDLRFLSKLVGLEELDLRRNRLSDGGFSTLAMLELPSLRKLDLRFNSAITEGGKQALRRRLPDCEFLFEGQEEP